MEPHLIPQVPTKLVEYLEKTIPNVLPAIDWDDRRLASMIGQRAIVTWLRAIHDEQQKPKE